MSSASNHSFQILREAAPELRGERHEILFILDSLADWQTLAAAAPPTCALVLLDADGDALAQVADYLAALPQASVDAIHLVSHGFSGGLNLGSLTLSDKNLDDHAGTLAQIGAALTKEGDILLYGCDVAAGEAGVNFIGRLAQATGADVAASEDATGAADLGGNWVLEYAPEVESRTLGVQGELADYDALLALPGGEQTYDLSTFTDNGLVLDHSYFTVSGITSGSNPAGMSNDGGPAYVDGASSTDATTTVTIKVAVDASDLASFELTNINLSDFDDIPTSAVQNLQIIGHKSDGTGTVSSGTVNGTADDDNFTSANIPGWGNFFGVQLDYYEITWSFNNGGGFTALDIDFISFSVTNMTGPNSAPVLTLLNGDSVTFTEDGSAVLLDTGSNAMVSDTDSADFNGGHVTVSIVANRVSGEDVLAVRHEGTNAGQIGVSGSTISYGGAVIGAFTGGTGTNDLVVTFNSASATPEAAQALIRNLTYANTNSGNPSTSNRTVQVTVNDGDGGTSAAADIMVGITAVNDDPTISSLPSSVTVTEDTAGNVDLSAATFGDPDSGANSISLTIAAGAGTLAATSGGGVTIGGSGSDTLTLSGTAANIDTYLNTASNIQYTGVLNANGNNATTLTLTANDGGNTGTGGGTDVGLGTVNVNITAVNDAPTLSGGPFALSGTDEDTTSAGTLVSEILTGVTYADVDFGAFSGVAVTGLTGNGTWQYSTDGNTWTAFGAVSPSAALLLDAGAQVRYVPDGQDGENAGFTFRAWDQTSGAASTNGSPSTADATTNGGTTAFSTATETASITVTAVNDAPTISAGTTTAFTEQTPTAIAPAISISDPDGDADWNGGTLTVQITANASADDSLRLPSSEIAGIWLNAIDSSFPIMNGLTRIGSANAATVSGDTNWTFIFEASATNTLVQEVARAVQFGNDSDDPSTAERTITFTATDKALGNNAATQIVTITPVNDPPQITNQADPALAFSGAADSYASFADVDNSISGAFTLESWVKFNNLTSVQFISGQAVEQMELHTSNNTLRFIPTGGVYVDTGAVLVVDQWTHIAASYDANSDLSEIYINGVKVASQDNNAAVDEALKSTLSSYRLGIRGDGAYPLDGAIAEYRIWNDIRTADEIRDYMNVSLQGNEANLVALWKLDEGSGIALEDGTANNFEGAANNAGWISRPVSGGLAISYSEGAAPVAVFSDTSVTTVESGQHIKALTLTVTNLSDSTEYLRIDGSSVALTHGTSGTTASSIGYSVSVAGSTATVSLTHAGLTEEQTASLINGISYSNSSQTPTTANPRVVSLTAMQDDGGIADGGDDSATLSLASAVTLVGVNDSPALSATASDPTYAPGGTAADLFSGVTISTVEAGQNITALTLTVTNVTDGASEILVVDGTDVALTDGNNGTTTAGSFEYSVALGGGTATLTLTKTDTAATWQTLVDGLKYSNSSDNPTVADRVVTLTEITDDGGTANGGVDTADIHVASTVTFGMPSIDSAAYDWASGQLTLTGQNFVAAAGAANDITANLLTIIGEGGSYTLTDTPDVEITSATSATLTLSVADQMNVRGLLNKSGTASSGAVPYNLAAADNWLAGSPTGSDIADAENGITVSNVALPTIASAIYDSDTGVLEVTGTNLFGKYGAANDIDVSALTFTGGTGNATYALTSGTDVEITSATSFTVTLSGTDKTNVDALLDQIGTASSGGSTYNLAAAEDWLTGADPAADIADATNPVTVSIAPIITSATYDAATGAVVVIGTNIQANGGGADIDAGAFTLTGEGGETYNLTDTPDVERDSATQFTLTLSATDRAAVNQILNKNGTASTGGASFNLAAADDWCTNVTAGDTTDATNPLTVSNVPVPVITSATYDAASGVLTVTGTGLVKCVGAANDIDIAKLTLSGEGGASHTLTSDDVEITSGTSFTVTLNAPDREALGLFLNKNGATSTGGTDYNLAATEDWARGADAAVNIADLAGNAVNVSNVPVPTITSATYDGRTNVLTVTGTGFSALNGADNDIDASKFVIRGEGGALHTLTDTLDVEITSATSFSLTLSATDSTAVEWLLTKEGTLSSDNTPYNLAATEDWARGADAAVTIVDSTNGITVALNAPPVITSDGGGTTAAVNVAENTTAVTTITATDADSDPVTYSLSGGADAAKFEINAGVLTFANAPNFENPQDLGDTPGNNTYEVEVTADDGHGGTDVQTLTVTVTDVNEPPDSTDDGMGGQTGVGKVLSTADFGAFSDPDGDALTAVKIISLPGTGSLSLNGSAVEQNDVISVADINAGKLVFTPGAEDAVIGFQVGDGALFSGDYSLNVNVVGLAASDTTATTLGTWTDVYGTAPVSGFEGAVRIVVEATNGHIRLSADTSGVTGIATGYGDLYDGVATSIAFEGTQAQVNAALQLVQAGAIGAGTVTLAISAVRGGSAYNPDNGHYYEAVEDADGITWVNAKAAAAGRTFNGLTGYLTTITSAEENAFILDKLPADGWIGASDNALQINLATGEETYADDNAAEGHWYWVTGPEAGTQFWTGASGGSTVDGQYANWNTNQPDNWPYAEATYADEEDYAEFYSGGGSSGRWNDLPGAPYGEVTTWDNLLTYYVVEYGGIGSAAEQASRIVTLAVNSPPVITSNGGGETATVDLLENTTTVTTVIATDADSDPFTYAISGGDDADKFAINETTGVLTFKAAPDFETPTDADTHNTYIVEVTADDGQGGADAQTLTVTVTNANEAPTFANLNGGATLTEGAAAVILDSDVTVADLDLDALNSGNGDYNGASLTVARNGGANAEDLFDFATSGVLFSVSGGNLQSGGQTFATFTSAGGTLTINFTSTATTATKALVNDLLQHISYQNSSDDPPAGVSLDWTFSDGNAGAQGAGGAGNATGSTTVTINGVNDPPTLVATGQNPTFVEGSAAADLFSAVTASTVESGQNFTSLTLTVTNVSDGADEILRFDGSDVALTDGNSVNTATNGLSVNVLVTGSTATVSFTSTSLTPAQLQTLVDDLAYRNTSDAPTTGSNRAVTITQLTDSGANTGDNDNTADFALSSIVSLTAANDPPLVGGLYGETSEVIVGAGAQDVTGLNDATVSNPDSADYNGGFLTIIQGSGTTNGSWGLDGSTATAGGDGTLAAGETIAVGGVSIGAVHATNDGQGGNTLQIDFNSADATSARIQTLLQGLTYSAPSSLGARTFTLTLNDGGGIANGGDADSAGNFQISVTPNPPVIANLNGDSVNAANGSAVTVDQDGNVTVTDADSSNFNGGNLLITRTTALFGNFLLTGSGSTGVSSGTSLGTADGTIAGSEIIYVDGVAIASISAVNDGQGTNDLRLNLGSNATPASVQTLIRALQFVSTTAGEHTFSLTVTDAGSSAATSTAADFTVNVAEPNIAPVITSDGGGATAAVNVAENTTAVTTVTATDADSDPVTYSLSGGDDAAKFQIDDATGVLRFVAAPNFENPTDSGGDNTYEVEVTADDGHGGTDVQALTVTVTDVNEAPTAGDATGATDEDTLLQVAAPGLLANATDADAGDILTLVSATLTSAQGAAVTLNADGSYTYNPASAATLQALGAGQNTIDTFSYTITDNNGLTDTATVTITLAGVNDPPVITSDGGGAAAAVNVAENTTAVTTVTATDIDGNNLTYGLTGGVDAALFQINARTGVLNFITAPDYENPADVGGENTYQVTVQVSDGALTDNQTLTITVTDVQENPAPQTIDGMIVTQTIQPEENGITLTTLTIPVVPIDRQEDPATEHRPLADIPLAQGPGGEVLLQAGLPLGIGLTSQEITAPGLTLRDTLIAAAQGRDLPQADLDDLIANGIDRFVGIVPEESQVTVRTLVLTSDGALPGEPILIQGATGFGEDDLDHFLRQEAVLIDARHLSPGSVLQLDRIEFAIILGDVKVLGGEGNNFALGDSGSQYLVLGDGYDRLQGGGGEDVIGSRSGNDRIRGDAGHDCLIGGEGSDTLEGGDGDDIVQGGQSDAGAWNFSRLSEGPLRISFASHHPDLAQLTAGSMLYHYQGGTPWTEDARMAFTLADPGDLETIALLCHATFGRLPSAPEINEINCWGLSSAQLAELAWGAYQTMAGDPPQTLEDQVGRLIDSVWCAGSSDPELNRIGADYLQNGGAWSDALLFLARHENHRNGLIDNAGELSLTLEYPLGETGWSADTGNDRLRGGAGDDLLIGGRGSDYLDGGPGFDRALQINNLAHHQFRIGGDGLLFFQIGAERDFLIAMEEVTFGDQSVDVSCSNLEPETLKAAAALHRLMTGQAPSLSELNAYPGQAAALAAALLTDSGCQQQWGGLDSTGFIARLALEVLDAPLAEEDLTSLAGQLDNGDFSRGEAFILCSGIPEYQQGLFGGDGLLLA